MSASDQEEVTETPESRPESKREPNPEPEAESGTDTSAGDPDTGSETAPESEPTSGPDTEPESGPDTRVGDPADAGHDDTALTPRQARRIRVTVASVLLVAMAALLAVRLANRSSVLVVGVYGLAMILCGVVIELSRHGRTRLATWVLGVGLAATLATDWLLLP
ncbi:hypothetical protein SSPS47_08600 [Streptomyces sp. S4.7]|uniref:hypothetical protein n=1 Tax=Streptomyces sp. S4.7 TaxID=2705439 RepID=UPI0013974ACD|nr:hypothetical protein [Streptomyces sp. S4.7]QHY95181.1 hypothetical protein SSPS47_08600 [Streptomyces sp. S4.7]